MLILTMVMFLVALSLFGVFFRIALRNSRAARAKALDPSDAIFRGAILLNSNGGFDDPGLYEIVVLPNQIQIQVRPGLPHITGAEWFLDPAQVELQPFGARFLWKMQRRPAIRLRYKPEGAVVSFLVLASRDGRDQELTAALEQVVTAAKQRREPRPAN